MVHLPLEFTNLWGVAVEFATRGKESQSSLTEEQAKILTENIQELDALAFSTDRQLLDELINLEGLIYKPLALILISQNDPVWKQATTKEGSALFSSDL